MLRPALAAALLSLAVPAWADDFPQGPKAPPPQPLPEAPCDTAAASDGSWLVGNWVAPRTRWSFERKNGAIAWTMDRKGGLNEGFGWQDGATISGTVATASACTVSLTAGQGAFAFEGVLMDGKLFGYAVNQKGDTVRFTLRRER